MSQEQKILAHLKAGRTITPLDAFRRYGCLRLSARIEELRDAGYKIRTTLIAVGGKRVARYSLG